MVWAWKGPLGFSLSARAVSRPQLHRVPAHTGRWSTLNMSSIHSGASRRRFAPVTQSSGDTAVSDNAAVLRGVVFDMDGTLCEPQNYMFGQMRSALGITKSVDILDHIYELPDTEQQEAMEKIRAIEREAMSKQVAQPGLTQLMEFLDRNNLRKGICTRNFDAPVTHLLTNHIPKHIVAFTPIITREFRPPKPSPAGILHIAHDWKIISDANVPETPPAQRPLPLIMVGDSVDDMAAGRDAGAMTVLLRSEANGHLVDDDRTDIVIDRLDDLVGLLESGISARK